jgi:hypothetical protein
MGLAGSFWPSPEQELLLAVAIGDEEQVARAWVDLRRRVDLDQLEPGSFALLPLVYRALSQAEVKDSRLERLKGIYRSTWAKNNLLVERAKETLAALDRRVILLGGIATALRFYGDLALRPTPTLDLLVEPEARASAAEALEGAGWTPTARGQTDWLVDTEGRRCTLRASVASGLHGNGELWDSAEQIELGDVDALVLSPTDELLATCVTGARAGPFRSIAWIPDAVFIIRSGQVDWDRLVGLAIRSGQALRLRDSLAYLSSQAAVPAEARDRLAAAPVTRRERVAHALTAGAVKGLGGFPHTLGEHLASGGAMRSLPAFLRERWDLEHGWQLPFAAGRRAWRVLRGRSA